MTNWPPTASLIKAYISLVVLASAPILVIAAYTIFSTPHSYYWLILLAITLLTVPVFVRLPNVRSLITIGDAFVISTCMLYGTSQAVITNFLYMTLLMILFRKKLNTTNLRIVFNIATAVINVRIYSFVYEILNPLRSFGWQDIVLPTFGIALAYFISNSVFVATAVALTSGKSILSIWKENYGTLVIDFLVSAAAAGLITAFGQYNIAAPLFIAPFVGAIWAINEINRRKTIEAQQHLKEQEQLYLRTVESLALAVDAKDQTTYGHIRRVRAYAMGLAKLSGITDANELMAIETGSLLHDIGKLAIDDYILNKPGRLNKQEFDKMKMHTTAGDEILQQIQYPFPVAQVVRCHHERWDGQGYPDGLKGTEIPIGARILSIADSFDAIRSSRPYKLSFGIQDSIEILRAQAGTLYDPELVRLFIEHAQELERTAEEEAKNVPKLSFRRYFEKVDLAISAADSALSHAELHAPARAESAELVLLSEFCSSLGRHLDLSEVFPILCKRLERLLRFDTCVFFLERGDDTIGAAYATGRCADRLGDFQMSLGKGISGWVVAYKRPLLNAKPALEFQSLDCELKSFGDSLVTPLISDGNCLGAVSLYAEAPESYAPAHLTLLQTVSNQIAPLISEARTRKDPAGEAGLTDPVTQTYRAGYLSVAGAQMISSAERTQAPLSLLCLNIKNLAQMTNLYGMEAADTIMHKVAETLKAELRETDILVRYGHQGFVALLPGVRRDQAARYAQRLQHQIRNASAVNSAGQTFLINCQAALASFPTDGATIFALLQTAQKSFSEHGRPAAEAEGNERNILEFPIRI